MKLSVLESYNNGKIIIKTKEMVTTEVRAVIKSGQKQGIVTEKDKGCVLAEKQKFYFLTSEVVFSTLSL